MALRLCDMCGTGRIYEVWEPAAQHGTVGPEELYCLYIYFFLNSLTVIGVAEETKNHFPIITRLSRTFKPDDKGNQSSRISQDSQEKTAATEATQVASHATIGP